MKPLFFICLFFISHLSLWSQDPLAPVRKGDLWGFINTKGILVIPYQFSQAQEFQDGAAVVTQNEKDGGLTGFIGLDGKWLVPPTWDGAGAFSEGLAPVLKGNVYGYINKKGQTVIPFRFRRAQSFSEGLAAVIRLRTGYWSWIDTQGKIVIQGTWDSVGPFRESVAPVSDVAGNWGYVDKKGKNITGLKWDWTTPFYNGLAAVRSQTNQGWGMINRRFETVIPMTFDYISDYKEGLIGARKNLGEDDLRLWGFLDGQGNVKIPHEWQHLLMSGYRPVFGYGLAPVVKDELYGFINNQGKMIISPQFDYALSFGK